MKISLVIPVYNKGYILERCLRSVYSQTRKPDQVIIVNDGSTDNSLAIINKFVNDYMLSSDVLIVNTENGGVSKARNIGICKSKHEYITFLDSDDEWDSNYLEDMTNFISLNPDGAIFGCLHRENINDLTIIHQNSKVDFSGEIDFFKLSKVFSIVNSSKVIIKKSYVLTCLFPENSAYGEDLFVWIKIALCGKCYFLNKELVTINSFYDSSRESRQTQVLYPIVALSRKDISNNQRLSIYIKSLVMSTFFVKLRDGNTISALKTLKYSFNKFPIYSILLFPFVFIPPCIYKIIYRRYRG